MPKPGDFFIGVTEFFAVLMPGAVLVFLLAPEFARQLPQAAPADEIQGWVAFLVASYIAGQLLYALGALLDPFYDHVYLRVRRRDHFKTARFFRTKPAKSADTDLEPTLLGRAYALADEDSEGTSLYDWILSLTRLRIPAAAAEIDRYQANSKLFRSLPFVFVVAAILMARDNVEGGVTAALLAAALSVYQYCELRWGATKRAYEYYLLFHRYPQVGTPKD